MIVEGDGEMPDGSLMDRSAQCRCYGPKGHFTPAIVGGEMGTRGCSRRRLTQPMSESK